jgi:hypothetical protein
LTVSHRPGQPAEAYPEVLAIGSATSKRILMICLFVFVWRVSFLPILLNVLIPIVVPNCSYSAIFVTKRRQLFVRSHLLFRFHKVGHGCFIFPRYFRPNSVISKSLHGIEIRDLSAIVPQRRCSPWGEHIFRIVLRVGATELAGSRRGATWPRGGSSAIAELWSTHRPNQAKIGRKGNVADNWLCKGELSWFAAKNFVKWIFWMGKDEDVVLLPWQPRKTVRPTCVGKYVCLFGRNQWNNLIVISGLTVMPFKISSALDSTVMLKFIFNAIVQKEFHSPIIFRNSNSGI